MKTVLVTGASRGLGRSIILEYAKHGYNVVIHYREASDKASILKQEVEKNYHDKLVAQGQKKLKSNKLKILLVGHHYNLEDALIGKRISSYLRKENIELLYSYEVPQEAIDKYSYQISTKIHWTMNKELLAAFAYFKDQVDGVIILTAFPCGPDSLANEMMIRKRGNSKVLLLTFEDLSSDTAIITRLESFIDMIKGGIHL